MKITKYKEEARELLKEGVQELTNAVASTLGGAGKGVIIDTLENNLFITSDGVTVAQHFELQHSFKSMGVNLMKQVTIQANANANDGTTTSAVLGNEFIQNDAMVKGHSSILVRKGMEKAISDVKAHLQANKHVVNIDDDSLTHIATVSTRGDVELGKLIADAYRHIGKDGHIIVEEARGEESTLELINGVQMDKGYYLKTFINNTKRNVVEFENPLILLTDIPIQDPNQLMPMLTHARDTERPIVIIAPEIEEKCLLTLTTNLVSGVVKCVFIEAPEFGDKQFDLLTDISKVVGCDVMSKERNDSLMVASSLSYGECASFIANESASVFINGVATKEEIDAYIETIPKPKKADDTFYKLRIGKLSGRVAKLKIGAPTYMELQEKRFRTEDAVGSTKHALMDGYIIGGGIPLFRASLDMLDTSCVNDAERAGYNLVKESIKAPLRQILFNLYENNEDVVTVVTALEKEVYDIGYNVTTMEYENFLESGILDPIKVTLSALDAAFSIASTVLNTNAIIAITGNEKEELEF